ncbi:MAG: 6-phosphogluconolactonase [Algisphaera sp.]
MNNLPGSQHVSPDTETLFEALGESLMSCAMSAAEERGVFHIALSGGGTPEPFYIRLMTDPKFRLIPWAKTHLWIVDERCVPEDHEKSNIKMIREALADHCAMPAEQVHAMPVLADDPAGDYEAQLTKAFDMTPDQGVPKLDWVLLGMGGDCHTASLFPESPALASTRWIDTNDGEKVVPPPRVTMTYPLINAAREIVVLAVGAGKTAALTRVADQMASGSADPVNIPISGIAPENLTWYLDDAAAG